LAAKMLSRNQHGRVETAFAAGIFSAAPVPERMHYVYVVVGELLLAAYSVKRAFFCFLLCSHGMSKICACYKSVQMEKQSGVSVNDAHAELVGSEECCMHLVTWLNARVTSHAGREGIPGIVISVGDAPRSAQHTERERASEHIQQRLLPAPLLLLLLFATARSPASLHHLTPRLIFLSASLTGTQGTREVWTQSKAHAINLDSLK